MWLIFYVNWNSKMFRKYQIISMDDKKIPNHNKRNEWHLLLLIRPKFNGNEISDSPPKAWTSETLLHLWKIIGINFSKVRPSFQPSNTGITQLWGRLQLKCVVRTSQLTVANWNRSTKFILWLPHTFTNGKFYKRVNFRYVSLDVWTIQMIRIHWINW